MATRQTVMWTALPNGVRTGKDGTHYLILAAFMSPRLTSTTAPPLTLGLWPDFTTEDPAVNWASTVTGLGFVVEVQRRTKRTVYRVPGVNVRRTSNADPALWSELFGPDTPVDGYVMPNLRNVKVNSFPVRDASVAVRDHIAAIASKPDLLYRIPTPETILDPGGLIDNPLTAHLATRVMSAGTVGIQATPPPADLTLYDQFNSFHRPYMTADQWNPRTPEQLAEERKTDFHRSMSALGNYPALLPMLGIVVNFEITLTAAVLSELNGASRVRIVPGWPGPGDPSVQREDAYPWTAFTISGRSTATGYRVSAFRATPKTSELKDGYLVVRDTSDDGVDDPVTLSNIDVDIAVGRLFARLDGIVQQIDSRVLPQTMSLMSAPDAQATETVVPADDLQVGLSTLGQPTIALSVNRAAPRLAELLATTQTKNDLLAARKHTRIVHHAEELIRGYRVDVWDSATKVWHPLCGRSGNYRLGTSELTWNGDEPELVDEGWIQLAPESNPADDSLAPQEMRLSEQVFSWNGWSLVIERPGAALAEGSDGDTANAMRRTYVGPDGETYPLGEFDNPGLPLTTSFRVPPGTLPRLRLGTTYRFRARAVDLAGNSVPFAKGAPTDTPGGTDDKLTTVTRALTHKRYEPVKPPVVVLKHDLAQGETPQHLVVASNYNTLPAATTSRHICPPRTSFTMAEAHGAFDLDAPGRPMDGSGARYNRIAQRDAWDFPHNDLPPDDPAHGQQLPIASIPSPLPYLADVPSRGVSFSGLPGQRPKIGRISYTDGKVTLGSTRVERDDGVAVTSDTLRIPFSVGPGDDGDRRPFLLVVRGVEGTDVRLPVRRSQKAPSWNGTRRELHVQLPKAEQVEVEFSSFVDAEDLNVFGSYQWGIAKSILDNRPQLFASMLSTDAYASSVMTPKAFALPLLAQDTLAAVTNTVIDLSVLGRNWTITPHNTLTLVHPVQQPMIAPNLTHRLRADRRVTQTTATLIDWVQVHGKSTARIAMNANWTESVDDPADGPPKWGHTAVRRSGQAFDIPVGVGDTVALSVGKDPPEGLAMPVSPVTTNLDAKAQRHSFGDTKHRHVRYSLVASSRFQHYFPPEATTTRQGNSRWLHVPSTARPLAPVVDLVIPTFKWTRTNIETGPNASSTRGGGRLRVYLERPWFSSGDDEKLAVLLWRSTNSSAAYSKLQPYVTEWGNDPLYRSRGSLPDFYPKPEHFSGWASKKTSLNATEFGFGQTPPIQIDAMIYDVDYDEESDRWFADITIQQGNAYLPFIKLALARYQEYSVPNRHLSTTVAVDAVQLTPNRSASVSWANPRRFTVFVNGRSFEAARSGYGPRVTITAERRQGDGFAWRPYTLPGQVTTEFEMETYQPFLTVPGETKTFWRKVIDLGSDLEPGDYRIVVREYERHLTGDITHTLMGSGKTVGARPVYVDVLPLKQPPAF